MGQKTNPVSLRLGINRSWDSRWAHDKHYSDYLEQDILIRSFIEDICSYQDIFIGKLCLWRTCSKLNFELKNDTTNNFLYLIYTQMYVPHKTHYAMTWDEKREWLYKFEEKIQKHLEEYLGGDTGVGILIDPIFEENAVRHSSKIKTDAELGNNDLLLWLLNKDALLISQWIAHSFAKRKGLKELCKKVEKAFDTIQKEQDSYKKYDIQGIKITCSGRFKLTDNEKRRNKMARVKTFKKGQIPLQTLNKYVDYSTTTAYTPDGTSGIKVWICYELVEDNLNKKGITDGTS